MNQTGKYALSIIVPIYNEEDNLIRLTDVLADYLKHSSVKSCVLFVNDGSTDKSLVRIADACSQNLSMFFISFEKNKGLSAAIKAGIDHVFSPYTGYMDADLQTTPEDFERLLPYRQSFELITGIRAGRKDRLTKRITSKIANTIRRMFTHDGIEDTGCPLKIINTTYAKRIPFFKGMHRFLPALILLQKGKIKQIPVRHFERIAGKSKFHTWNRLIDPLKDCFAYRWMKKRYIHYSIETGNLNEVQ